MPAIEVSETVDAPVIRDEGRECSTTVLRIGSSVKVSASRNDKNRNFIFVPTATAREVTVLGAVAQPRTVPYVEGMGLIRAIAHANGTVPEAYQHHVAIVRGSLSEPRVGIIDYRDIATGRAPDVVLEPGDIVYVPFGPYRYLVRYADLVLRTFVNTVAINEGTRAVGGVQSGVVIPVGGGTQVVAPQPPVVR